VSNLSKYF